jgi:protein phosphatase
MMKSVGRTHAGGARDGLNQDAVGWDDAQGLAFVADGMGGHAGGEEASRLVKQVLLERGAGADLEGAVMRAHREITAAAATRAEHAGMGATVVALHIAKRRAKVVWVGDSRGYLWRQGSLRPLTRDHSVMEAIREQEDLTETQVRSHPLRHKVIQALGKDTPVPSVREFSLRRGDRILLCSDGLSGELRDHEIGAQMRANTGLDRAADALVNGALAKGGSDNVSVVLVEYTGSSGLGFDLGLSEDAIFWLSILGGILSAVVVARVWWWFGHRH